MAHSYHVVYSRNIQVDSSSLPNDSIKQMLVTLGGELTADSYGQIAAQIRSSEESTHGVSMHPVIRGVNELIGSANELPVEYLIFYEYRTTNKIGNGTLVIAHKAIGCWADVEKVTDLARMHVSAICGERVFDCCLINWQLLGD